MSLRKSNLYVCAVLLVFGFTAHAASSQAVKSAPKSTAIPFDAQAAIKVVDQIKSKVLWAFVKPNPKLMIRSILNFINLHIERK